MKSEGGRSDSRLIFGYPVNNANKDTQDIYEYWMLLSVDGVSEVETQDH